LINETEESTSQYLLSLPAEERESAARRINQLVRAGTGPDDSSQRPPVRTLDEYLETDIPTPPFLVSGGQLVRGEITVTIARAGKGKTTLGMNRMIRWAAGLPLFEGLDDSQVAESPMRIMMIENEGVASFMQSKLGLLKGSLTDEQAKLAGENMLIWGDGGYSGLKIDRDRDIEVIRQACEIWKPDALFLEPFRGIWTGDENDATAMEAVLDSLVQLGHDFECGIMLAHHERKSGAGEDGEAMSAARGNTALEGKCAIMENYRAVKGGTYRELTWSKSRFHTAAPPVRMLFDPSTWQLELVAQNDVEQSILGLMQEDPDAWYWTAELADELNESHRKVRESLGGLLDDDRIVRRKGTPERQGYRFRLKTDELTSGGGLDIT
jgi:hypothetical protein